MEDAILGHAVQNRHRSGRRTKPLSQKIFTPADPMAHHSRVEKGALAEDFAHYRLRRHGVDVYRPAYSKEAVDFIVLAGDRVLKCQVKATASADLVIKPRHTVYSAGRYSRQLYAAGVVDIFIMVDLMHEHIFVMPDAEVRSSHTFVLVPGGRAWPFKDRYDLLL